MTAATFSRAELVGMQRLLSWLSPAMPTGAFSFSHGVEAAISVELIHDADSLQGWLQTLLQSGSLRSEAIILAHACRAAAAGDDERIAELNALSLALGAGRERVMESRTQGEAFQAAVAAWALPSAVALPEAPALPIALACACASTGLPVVLSLSACLTALVGNLVWIAVRLVPLGQQDGLRVIAALEPVCLALAEAASEADIEAIGSACLMADILSLQHETQTTRICIS